MSTKQVIILLVFGILIAALTAFFLWSKLFPKLSQNETEIALSFSVQGCAETDKGMASKSFNAGNEQEPKIEVDENQIRYSRAIIHLCCRKTEIEKEVSGSVINILEYWSGIGCKCECFSEIEATLKDISPGVYLVNVYEKGIKPGEDQNEPMEQRLIISQKVKIKKAANSKPEAELSKLYCEINPVSGKKDVCSCIANQNKIKLTVIIKKDGILDNAITKQKLNAFLNSVKNDLSIKNVGISYFAGDSAAELDSFIEELYYNKEVGYAIIIDEQNLYEEGNEDYGAKRKDLSLVDKTTYFFNEQGERQINPEAHCREVALSWIFPPLLYSDVKKIEFLEGVIDKYTDYHNNAGNILGQYQDAYLHIQWENGHPNIGADIPMADIDYPKNKIQLFNHEYEKIAEEFAKKHYLLFYNVHGGPTSMGLGLNPNNEADEYSAVFTTLEEFSDYAKQIGTPFLLIQPASCGSAVIQDGLREYCCWPQIMLDVGTWAYYGFWSGYNNADLGELLSEGPFFGHIIRNNPIKSFSIFGDVTAHFKH